MYMNLITESFVSKDTETFIYYSRFFIQHLYWNMVRLPDKNGYYIFEEKDIDARLKSTDFHIETVENKQAFRAFLEFIQRESQYKGIYRMIHNTQQEDSEALQNVADYFFGLKAAHSDFKPTTKFTRVTSRGYIDDISAHLLEEVPAARAVIERISETPEEDVNKYDDHNARMFLGRNFSKVMSSHFKLVPAGEGDDKDVKQTIMTRLRQDPVVNKAALRYFRCSLASSVATYMK